MNIRADWSRCCAYPPNDTAHRYFERCEGRRFSQWQVTWCWVLPPPTWGYFHYYVPRYDLLILGMVIQPLTGNPYKWIYIYKMLLLVWWPSPTSGNQWEFRPHRTNMIVNCDYVHMWCISLCPAWIFSLEFWHCESWSTTTMLFGLFFPYWRG